MPGAQYNALRFELGVRDITALVGNFAKADATLQDELRRLAREGGDDVSALTAMLAPKDTTFMSRNVRVRFTPSGLGFEVGWDAADFYNAGLEFYPWFQEFGTYKMAPQPSLGPAAETVLPDYQRKVSDALARSISRLGR